VLRLALSDADGRSQRTDLRRRRRQRASHARHSRLSPGRQPGLSLTSHSLSPDITDRCSGRLEQSYVSVSVRPDNNFHFCFI